eukprot:TRINITY_DN27684_c0_g1_i1.p1 TRINITY_DN27684_c0_g1~~TRINITY_DN27684_c0_g1_i1.p1  ORF type:complete len:106 (+),score=22.96 TRINITY_DN27684_c0_g1_i1:329-646(+)
MLIVQTKMDLIHDPSKEIVSKERAEAKAEELKLKLFRTSVKDNTNIQEVFVAIVKIYHDDKQRLLEQANKSDGANKPTDEKTNTVSGNQLTAPDKSRAKKKDGCC